MSLSIEPAVVDRKRRAAAVKRLRDIGGQLPTWSQLADPANNPSRGLGAAGPDAADPLNLWRVHWFNGADRISLTETPDHIVLPPELTGVKSPIVVLLGCRFPMIGAHKVLAAYACLVPRLVTGRFDPTVDRAVWPSTGNYCRGGVAISRILGCRGIAVLPAGMSRERFDWLQSWVAEPADIIRTPGTESNVKDIYDKCDELAKDEQNVIINQFSEFSNYLIHYHCTGKAFDQVFQRLKCSNVNYRLAHFVSATGSAGTIGAGDWLKERYGTKIAAVEALECPTMLNNGYGEHGIQGIGDKHIPLIHNIMNTDVVVGISETTSDALHFLFNEKVGRDYLIKRKRIDPDLVKMFDFVGISGFANIVASIKVARHFDYDENDIIMTVATDSAAMYSSERDMYRARTYPNGFDGVAAGELYGQHIRGVTNDNVLDLTYAEHKRVFHLGYYTWVEQRGVSLDDFDKRKNQEFWRDLVKTIPVWDRLIEGFNADVRSPGRS